eukprot:scaffold15430_cov50-Phaeocystis_antarctica.AAC.2
MPRAAPRFGQPRPISRVVSLGQSAACSALAVRNRLGVSVGQLALWRLLSARKHASGFRLPHASVSLRQPRPTSTDRPVG